MKITIELPNRPSRCPRGTDLDEYRRHVRASQFQHVLNALARINCDWVLQQWDVNVHPKCCAKCNGTKYIPDAGRGDGLDIDLAPLLSSPQLFARGHGSCGEIAACHTGHKIAEAITGTLDPAKYGKLAPMTYEEACSRFTVVFAKATDPKRPTYFHAICNDNGLVIDVTDGMKR